jgi:arylsulfatase A-like enzyme
VRTGEHDLYKNGEPFDREGVWSDTIFADEAIHFIENRKEKPFFIYLAFQAPHSPYQDPDKLMDPPGSKERKTLIKMVERLDLEIGRVLGALDKENISDDTLVILTSDNGGAQGVSRNFPLSGGKQMLLEGGVRVPLIFRWPGVLPASEESAVPISAMDLTATIAAAGGVSPPEDKAFDGIDMVPSLLGEAHVSETRPLFFRRRDIKFRQNLNSIRQSAVRQGAWKYLRSYKKNNEKYTATLFDLDNDIAEQNDISQTSPERFQEMSDLLENWEAELAKTAQPFPSVSKKLK